MVGSSSRSRQCSVRIITAAGQRSRGRSPRSCTGPSGRRKCTLITREDSMKETLAWTEYCKSLAPAVVETCTKVPVSNGPGAFVKALGVALPDWKFHHALSRGGWYRLGGIVDGDGRRVSDTLESWVEAALDERDGDFGKLIDDFAGQTLYATRLVGQTHYLVGSAGDGTDDFLQLEVEDLQEIRTHQLFVNEPS